MSIWLKASKSRAITSPSPLSISFLSSLSLSFFFFFVFSLPSTLPVLFYLTSLINLHRYCVAHASHSKCNAEGDKETERERNGKWYFEVTVESLDPFLDAWYVHFIFFFLLFFFSSFLLFFFSSFLLFFFSSFLLFFFLSSFSLLFLYRFFLLSSLLLYFNFSQISISIGWDIPRPSLEKSIPGLQSGCMLRLPPFPSLFPSLFPPLPSPPLPSPLLSSPPLSSPPLPSPPRTSHPSTY